MNFEGEDLMSSKFITLELSMEFVKDCRNLDMPYAEKDQLRRASMSIALNLAEGAGRFSRKEKRRFYRMAYASLKECRTLLEIIYDENNNASIKADSIGAKIWKLLQTVE